MPVPDTDTILKLQRKYAAAVLNGHFLPADILVKIERMEELRTKVARSTERSPQNINELAALAVEVAPYTNFEIDAVDWDKEWSPDRRELRHKGLVVRLDE